MDAVNERFRVMGIFSQTPSSQCIVGFKDSVSKAIELAHKFKKIPTWIELPSARATRTVDNSVNYSEIIPVKRN
jgi:hypothetical protein